MRVALLLPASTLVPGGVQRFGAELHRAMDPLADVECFRVHPRLGAELTVPSRVRAFVNGRRDLIDRHRTQHFDVVLTTFHWPFRLVRGVPMVGFLHDLRYFDLVGAEAHRRRRRSPEILSYRAIWRTWDRILVPSAHVAADVARLDGVFRVATVGEGLDHLDALRPEPDPPRDLLLVMGGSAPHKRGGLASEVAARIGGTLGCETVILGAVPTDPGAPVRVVRDYTDHELADFLSRARVFVAPSAYEGFGLAVGEAMRFGVPVVYAADCPMQDLVGDGGVAAAPEPTTMTKAVIDVGSRYEPLGARARALTAKRTWRATAERVLEELGTAIARRGVRGPAAPAA